jgi:hypothetical protein
MLNFLCLFALTLEEGLTAKAQRARRRQRLDLYFILRALRGFADSRLIFIEGAEGRVGGFDCAGDVVFAVGEAYEPGFELAGGEEDAVV